MKMRFLLAVLVAVGLFLAQPVQANTINFGSLNSAATSCSLAGSSGDRSCTHSGSVTNGANDSTASFAIRGQSSADHGVALVDPTAIADMTVTYDIPYTITRNLSIARRPVNSRPPVFDVTVPLQTITFDFNFSGSASKDSGGLAQAIVFAATVDSLGGLFTQGSYAGASVTGGGGLTASNFNRTTPDKSYVTTLNFSGSAVGEVSFAFQVPTNYRRWSDDVSPFVSYSGLVGGPITVGNPGTFTQSFSDTLRVSFRLRAESRPSGSVSTTGGEAIACAGLTSPLGSFALDNNAAVNCGTGFVNNASIAQTSSSTFSLVPEPSTALLFGLGIAGIAYFGRRQKD